MNRSLFGIRAQKGRTLGGRCFWVLPDEYDDGGVYETQAKVAHWTVPDGVHWIRLTMVGGGDTASTGQGALVRRALLPVVPGATLQIVAGGIGAASLIREVPSTTDTRYVQRMPWQVVTAGAGAGASHGTVTVTPQGTANTHTWALESDSEGVVRAGGSIALSDSPGAPAGATTVAYGQALYPGAVCVEY